MVALSAVCHMSWHCAHQGYFTTTLEDIKNTEANTANSELACINTE